jgi:hypothetical protein
MLTELKEQLYLVYTPAYDPDANRIEWPWRVSRRVVTHNRHGAILVSCSRMRRLIFRSSPCLPQKYPRHIGSPFEPHENATKPQTRSA